MIHRITKSEEETEAFACELAKSLCAGDVIAFRGSLGAGKTAFVRGLAVGLGILDDVSSPTFALIQEYKGANISLFHFDMYRITDMESLYNTGFYDYLDSNGILAIEWSENIAEALPPNHIVIEMKYLGDNIRDISVESGGRF